MARVIVTPAQRWVLANLFLHRSLSLNGGITQDMTYNRTRTALGLRGPSTVLLKGQEADNNLVRDCDTKAVAELTEEMVDFLLDKIFPLDKHPYQVATLEDFAADIQNVKRNIYNGSEASDPLIPNAKTLTETWEKKNDEPKEQSAR